MLICGPYLKNLESSRVHMVMQVIKMCCHHRAGMILQSSQALSQCLKLGQM